MNRDEAMQILAQSNELLVGKMAQMSELIDEMENSPERERQSWYDSLDHCQQEHDAVAFAVDFMRRAPLPDNKALTVEELRKMDGEPVWVDEINPPVWRGGERTKGWVLVRWDYSKTIAHSEHLGVALRLADYGKAWLAYRCPPEKGE